GLKPIAGVGTNTAGIIGPSGDVAKMPQQPGKFKTEQKPAVDKDGNPKKDKDGKPVMEEVPVKRQAVDKDGNPKVDKDGKPVMDLVPLLYEQAPAGEPRLITSWEQFKTTFGDFDQLNKSLAHAVYGFFNNGGTRAWVARVPVNGSPDDYRAVLDKF